MIISRTYDSQSLAGDFYKTIDCFIFGTVTDEERNNRLTQLWITEKHPASFHLDYDLQKEQYSIIQMPFGTIPDAEAIRQTSKDITLNLRNDFKQLGFSDKDILVDITGISQPAIFYMLKLFMEDVRPKRLFFAYTEPLRYKAKPFPTSEDAFELTEGSYGIKALPGFLRKHENVHPLVVLLVGFEGKRAKTVCDYFGTDNDDVRVILGFPGFRPGWQYLTYGGNQSMLEQYQAHRFISLAAANDPFQAYSALNDIYAPANSKNQRTELAIAPIGTKPHAVGAAIFALHHPNDTRLIYDFPVKTRHYRSGGFGITWIYNLTELLSNAAIGS